ncbi:MAG: SGNH/GDSL hydrolase family protein [Planctomycetes bacterium]|nr:SGNH/GDSL hydrolase family protein [Planctomycetota bacterium]
MAVVAVAMALSARRNAGPFRSLDEALSFSERSRPDADSAAGPTMNLRGIVRRSADADLVYELVPNLDCWFGGVPLATNSYGFRDREWVRPKPPAVSRLVALGDSILFGPGVDIDATFLRRVEHAASERRARRGLGPIQTLDFGVPGYNAFQEAALLRASALTFEPDFLVVCAVDNDDQLPAFLARSSTTGENDALQSRAEFFLGPDAQEKAEKVRRIQVDPGAVSEERVPREYRRMTGFAVVETSLREIASLAHERRIPMLVTIYGPQAGPDHDPCPHADRHAAIARLGTEAGFDVLDLHPIFTRVAEAHGWRDIRALQLGPGDPHLNVEGHHIVADAIVERMAALGWLDR